MIKYRPPAEWERHRACWSAWPSHTDLWKENLIPAQQEFAQLCHAIGQSEKLEILIPFPEQLMPAAHALNGLQVKFHSVPFGDIWLRDTACIFVRHQNHGNLQSVRFEFNGWGGKYLLEHDSKVSQRIADLAKVPNRSFSWVLEGGAVEMDGQGTCLTTRQCLLNPNRHPSQKVPTEAEIQSRLEESLGVKKILWIDQGLENDHTDGHIDNLVRFVAPAHVVCMKSSGNSDPNEKLFKEIQKQLSSFTDCYGNKLKVSTINSPGRFENNEGKVMPASFMNFYISNDKVIVPVYETEYDEIAIRQIAECFPNRKTVGIKSSAILTGGGSFHCITQQEPT